MKAFHRCDGGRYTDSVITDTGPSQLWLASTTLTSADFSGELGHRYTFVVTTTDNVSNVGQGSAETVATQVTKYYYIGSSRVAMRQGEAVTYLHTDHLGTVSIATGASAQVLARTLNLPYGSVRWSSGSMPTDFGFTGQKDTGLGLIYLHARYYSSWSGRFVSADTIVPEPTNPQSLNRFVYVNNNPIRYSDPTGHMIACGEGPETDCGGNPNHPVFVAPEVFGFIPNVNVDLLPYLFYQDPRQFEFTASVEWANERNWILAELFVPLIGQGDIPANDVIFQLDENYPVRSEIWCEGLCGPDDPRLWQRDIQVGFGWRTMFLSKWYPVRVNGETIMAEEFWPKDGGVGVVSSATAYLRPEIGDPSRPIGQKAPLKWRTVGFSVKGQGPFANLIGDAAEAFAVDQIEVIFETRQTGWNSIQTIGQLYVGNEWQGTIKLNGTYKGR